jgi:predicted PurR-regulated permease PerM
MTPSRRNTGTSGALMVILVLGIIAGLYFTRELLVPLAFALALTFLLTPGVSLLERLRIGRLLSVIVTILATVVATGFIAWLIASQLVDVANQLPQYRQNIRAKIQALRKPGKGPLVQAAQSVKEISQELSTADPQANASAGPQIPNQRTGPRVPGPPVPVQVVPDSTNSLTDLRALAKPFLGPLGMAGMVIIFTIFMLINREDLRNRVLRLVGLGQINIMTQALDDAARRVSRYLLMQLVINACFGALFGTGLYFLGVPNPALWGVLAALLRTVPYVGAMTAAALPIILSLAVFDGWLRPLLVIAVFAGLEVVTSYFVEPWLYGAHVGISSLALLAAAIVWTVLWGPAGLILSTPLTVCVVVMGRYFPQLSFLHILLGDEPVLEPEAQLYQRLLAMDQTESRGIVNAFLQGRSLIELYDSVLIPALSLAEQDRHNGMIDTAHEEFLFLSINEMIVEVSEVSLPSGGEVELAQEVRPLPGRVLLVPAHDQADAVAAAMLVQVLDHQGRVTLMCPPGPSPLEMLTSLQPDAEDVICVSAVPPNAFAPARSLCKEIRGRYPASKLLVGVWGFKGDIEQAKARFERAQPDQLITSLAQAVAQVEELTRQLHATKLVRA